eukprot:15249597-Heterocapsa_arctica.AAC.1
METALPKNTKPSDYFDGATCPVAAVTEDAPGADASETWGSKMLDLRGVAKPPLFDGRPLSYADWRFTLLA